MSQTDLAVRAGLSLPTVQRYERGARGTHERWTALAAALGVSVSSIQHGADIAVSAVGGTSSNEPVAGR